MVANKNKALDVNGFVVNGKTVDIHITTHGSDWYWAAMSVFGLSMIVILGFGLMKRSSDRIFHYIFAAAAFVAMVEHYSMAANLGWVPIDVEWQRPYDHRVAGINRQIWWVRYCGWFLIWPLLSLALLLGTAAPAVHVLWTCFLSSVMAIMAVVGAVVRTDYKWGYYGFWIWSWILIGYQLILVPRHFAQQLGKQFTFVHTVSSIWVWLLWMCYPICWGVSEGGNVIAPDSEFIFYGVLDCCLIPMTAAFFLAGHWNTDPTPLGLYIRTYRDPVTLCRTMYSEKQAVKNGHNETASGANGNAAEAQEEPLNV